MQHSLQRSALLFSAASALAFSQSASAQPAPASKPAAQAAAPAAGPRPLAGPPPLTGPGAVDAINRAGFNPAPPANAGDKTAAPDPSLIKAEVLLDRARFSPGVIDGRPGTNFKNALSAYQAATHLPTTGAVDQATWNALVRDGKPVAAAYTITPQDAAGPFAPDVGEDFVKLAALPQGPLYSRPSEMLAERFHMDEGLLTALNPGVDFGKAGSTIVVTQTGAAPFAKGDVKRVEVSKAHAEVTAFGDGDKVLAVYPATVGSTERPSPSGTHKVNGVAWNTDYTYDPSKLKWGPRKHGKLHVKPGPNGPVGVVWIALNAPDYGIHGTPDPSKIGKTASHGCVRLTNWDAVALAHGVKPGVEVTFVGSRGD